MKSSEIGGQAVIEGIMMRNGDEYAVAVRKPDGEIHVKTEHYEGISGKCGILSKIPFIRGIFKFADSMVLGIRTLMYSAEFFEEDEEEQKKELTAKEQEKKEMELLAKHKVNFIVLARYMQVISERMIDAYPNRIINIHHSFLPAFVGAKPYHAAFERGVKIIGATSHYVTTELDAGPIIEQDVVRITHKDTVEDLVNKGKDLEKIVLSRAVQKHIERKVLAYKNKTVIFS